MADEFDFVSHEIHFMAEPTSFDPVWFHLITEPTGHGEAQVDFVGVAEIRSVYC
jgi:hypothetical protein